jgi:NAD(P)H-dependent FMN reductase
LSILKEYNTFVILKDKYFNMPSIAIISASVRNGRESHHVTNFFKGFLEERKLATVDVLDLQEFDFPIFKERLQYLKELPPRAKEFTDRIIKADGVIIVTPEYNGGYPASLKNVIDFLYNEWHRKPIAITTVSNGAFGGAQVITSLQFTLWKIRAWVVPAMFPVPKVHEAFDEKGNAVQKSEMDKRATTFINELLWCIEAKRRMDTK